MFIFWQEWWWNCHLGYGSQVSFPRKTFSVRVIDLCCDAPLGDDDTLHVFHCRNFYRRANTNGSSFTSVSVLCQGHLKVINDEWDEQKKQQTNTQNMTSLTEGCSYCVPVLLLRSQWLINDCNTITENSHNSWNKLGHVDLISVSLAIRLSMFSVG